MRRLRLYLDTSVISQIDAPHAPDLEAITKEFFRMVSEKPDEYELVLSPVVQFEIGNCAEPKRSLLLQLQKKMNCTILLDSVEAADLANKYIEAGILSAKHIRDMTHIAYAAISRCDYIVSWNMKHFVREKTMSGVLAVNQANHYWSPFIVTPSIFLGDQNDNAV